MTDLHSPSGTHEDLDRYRDTFQKFFDLSGRRPVVLCDMDDVLVDYGTGLYDQFVEDNPGHPIKSPAERESFDLFGGESDDHKARLMAAMNAPGLYAKLKPLPGGFEALVAMVELGIDVRVCSAPWVTNPDGASAKYNQVEELGGPFFGNRCILSKDKTLVRGDLLIDDRSGVTGAMIPEWEQLLFTAPHNRLDTELPRLAGWENWQDTVLPMLGGIITRKVAGAA